MEHTDEYISVSRLYSRFRLIKTQYTHYAVTNARLWRRGIKLLLYSKIVTRSVACDVCATRSKSAHKRMKGGVVRMVGLMGEKR